jgi:hypothetical protein
MGLDVATRDTRWRAAGGHTCVQGAEDECGPKRHGSVQPRPRQASSAAWQACARVFGHAHVYGRVCACVCVCMFVCGHAGPHLADALPQPRPLERLGAGDVHLHARTKHTHTRVCACACAWHVERKHAGRASTLPPPAVPASNLPACQPAGISQPAVSPSADLLHKEDAGLAVRLEALGQAHGALAAAQQHAGRLVGAAHSRHHGAARRQKLRYERWRKEGAGRGGREGRRMRWRGVEWGCKPGVRQVGAWWPPDLGDNTSSQASCGSHDEDGVLAGRGRGRRSFLDDRPGGVQHSGRGSASRRLHLGRH